MKRVAIITMHDVCNMGAVLQAYALQQFIIKLGLECEIIDFIPNNRKGFRYFFPIEKNVSSFRKIGSWIKWFPHRLRWRKQYSSFRKEHLLVTKKRFYEKGSLLYKIDLNYDFYITGSDQVWNPASTNGFNPYYFLDFVKSFDKKISYAPSMSCNCFTPSQKEEVTYYLKGFKALSAREKTMIPLLNAIYIDAATNPGIVQDIEKEPTTTGGGFNAKVEDWNNEVNAEVTI